jgi:DNA replication protein DnaC
MPTSRREFEEMVAQMAAESGKVSPDRPRRRRCDCGAVLGEDDLGQCEACQKAAEAAQQERCEQAARCIRRNMWHAAQIPKRLQGARFADLDAATQAAVGLWIDDPDAALLTFTGAVGSGKTHAAVATVHESIARMPDDAVFKACYICERDRIARMRDDELSALGLRWPVASFVSWPDALADVREFRKDEDPAGRLAAFDGILLLDDLAAGAATDFGRETLYRIIDKRWRDGLRLVTTADVAPKALAERLGDRIASRLLSGTVLKIQGGDRRLTR